MDLKDMLYFCTIVEEGQISKAAKRLNISQPPLSLRLKELEEEVGCSSFPLQRKMEGHQGRTASLPQESADSQSHRRTGRKHPAHRFGVQRRGAHRHRNALHILLSEHRSTLIEKYPRISCRTVVADSPTIERYLQERSIELAVLRLNLSHNCYTTFNLPPQHMVAVYSIWWSRLPRRTGHL